jgi:hypothetical protein
MNAMTKLILTVPMPRIASIEVLRDLRVRVTWSAGIRARRTDAVDLAPLINSLKFYRPLRENRELFQTAHLIEGGTIVAWGADEEIDMAADSVEQLAEESMTANDFRDFLKSNNLTHGEAAALLGYSRRQIENFLSGELVPRVVAMACFGLAARRARAKNQAVTQQSFATINTTGDVSQTARPTWNRQQASVQATTSMLLLSAPPAIGQ